MLDSSRARVLGSGGGAEGGAKLLETSLFLTALDALGGRVRTAMPDRAMIWATTVDANGNVRRRKRRGMPRSRTTSKSPQASESGVSCPGPRPSVG